MSNGRSRDVETPQDLSRRLGLPFKDLSLLVRALTHDSYVNEHPSAVEDNERLEFLGDSVLGLVVGAWVFHHFPEMPEGDLTRMRSALVRNEQLARCSRRLDLARAMRLGRGVTITEGREYDNLLGCAFEALIGALYLDSGLPSVTDFVHPILEETYQTVLDQMHDPKSRLLEWSQARHQGTPVYRVLSATGPDHATVFEVEVEIAGAIVGRGQGTSKKNAERAAAQDAIQRLSIP